MMPDNDNKSFADFSGDLKQFAPRKSSKSGLSFWKMYYEASWSKLCTSQLKPPPPDPRQGGEFNIYVVLNLAISPGHRGNIRC